MKKNNKKLLNLRRFRFYIANTFWILSGNAFQIIIGFLVTIFMARYLGPEKLGVLAYAFSLAAVFSISGHMGLSGLIVRELSVAPDAKSEILGTTLALKCGGLMIGFLSLCCLSFATEKPDSLEFWILIIAASTLLFSISDVFKYWFEAHIQAKYITMARVIALTLSSCYKIGLILVGAKLLHFAFANLLQGAVMAAMLLLFYCKTSNLSVRSWYASCRKAKQLMSQGWIIFLGSVFAIIYFKIDQVMLKWLIGSKEVGIYAIASNISEVWYFVPTAIVASFFPRLIELHKSDYHLFKKRLQQLFDLLFILAVIVIILVSVIAEPLINFFYGLAYQSSISILVIHIWAGVFIFMRAVFSKWILIENALEFSLITQGLGALTNIVLNWLLIPGYGGKGAAAATLISYATASYISLFFYKKSRPIFWMMTRSFLLPFTFVYTTMRKL